MTGTALASGADYRTRTADFRWQRPENYNFVADTLRPWAEKTAEGTALWWLSGDGEERKVSYKDLATRGGRAAAFLAAQGIGKGDVVLIILSREFEWWEIILGGIQLGAVVSPGTTQLMKKDIAYRCKAADAKAIVTTGDICGRADDAIAESGWSGVKICLEDDGPGGWISYRAAIDSFTPMDAVAATNADDPALCYFTSGTTGQPKLTMHSHSYPLGHAGTGAEWLQAEPGALIWNLSDTGWAKAAWSSLFAPWVCGAGIFAFHDAGFDAEKILNILADYPVTTMCAPPTAYRMFVRMDISGDSFQALKHCVSAGEPLNPEVIALWKDMVGLDIMEGYGQTETVLLCGNFQGMEIKPGSMGLPAPGIAMDVIDEDGNPLPDDQEGDIAINIAAGTRPQGMFQGYLGDPERTAAVHRGDWYLTGDRATRDSDGYFWFVGRSDDVILSAGYRIGPFEVESALFEHKAVAESAVVSSPDETRGEVVKAFVVLAKGYEASDAMVKELQDFCKQATAPYKYPRRIEFVSSLPKTISGKVKRKELREQEWQK